MNNIAGGDWRFFYPENIAHFIGIPSSWDASLNTGIGQPALNTLWITGYLYLSSTLTKFGLSWNAISLVCWIIPIIFIGFISMFLLSRYYWNQGKSEALISAIIYTTNTYFLLIFSGGQLGVAFSYSFVPLVIYKFLKVNKNSNLFNSLFFGLVLALQIIFDPRITIITGIILIPVIFLSGVNSFLRNFKYTILIPILIVCLVHAYWILPLVLFYVGKEISPSIYKSTNDFSFFSFATLENTISLLHPNWPENVFGKVHFMRSEFIIIPIIAFGSTLVKSGKQTKKVVVLIIVASLCTFLAKGSNDPFGFEYIYMLQHVPGFSVFRDPTKFYIPIAISYSLLIPFSLMSLTKFIERRFGSLKNKNIKPVVMIVFLLFWTSLLVPFFSSSQNGLTRLKTVPKDYYDYKNFVLNQHQYFRSLWVPQLQRYGYFSNTNPAIGRGELFSDNSISGIIKQLQDPAFEEKLSNLSIKYVVVPSDPDSEIFTNNSKYDPAEYNNLVNQLAKIKYLKKVRTFGSIIVFQTDGYLGHFRFENGNMDHIQVISSTPSEYKLSINVKSPEILIFGESFDPNWIAKAPSEVIKSRNYSGLNSFVLPKAGSYNINIFYVPQKWVTIFFVISSISILLILMYLALIFFKSKQYDKSR